MAQSSTFTISDLAREFDLTTRAIRFYEDMGLLQPQREGPGGRNRVYSSRDRTRLKLQACSCYAADARLMRNMLAGCVRSGTDPWRRCLHIAT